MPKSSHLLFALCVALPSCARSETPKVASAVETPIKANFNLGKKIYVSANATQGDGTITKPFSTVKEALTSAKGGDSVILKAGTYRERITLPTKNPLILKAEEGARVVISGAEVIGGWKPFRDKIFVATLDWQPKDLYVNSTRQGMAREPNQGWYTIQSLQGLTIGDAEHLSKRSDDLVGGHAQFFQRSGTVFYSKPIVAQDKANGTVDFDPKNDKWIKLKANDSYILKNRLSLLDQAGEWVVEAAESGKYKVYFWPLDTGDLKSTQSPRLEDNLISVRNGQNLRIEGLEVTGSAGKGIEVNSSSDVQITRCVVHNNAGTGISLRQIRNSVVSRCLSLHNNNGINALSAHDLTIEENEVAFNNVDGIVVGGDVGRYGKPDARPEDATDGVIVRRNYVHHHTLFGHPDNMQLYRGVKNIKFIENLAIGAGQGLHTEEVDGAELTGNVFLSSAAYLVIFGHENSDNWKISRNTFGLSGYGVFIMSGKNYDARQNIYIGGVTTAATYTGDYNLYSNGLKGTKSVGQDANSQLKPALLTNVPKAHAIIENKPDSINTAHSLQLRGGQDWLVGDTIEVNWDGVGRKITASDEKRINFAPALPAKPISNFAVVANWGSAKSMTIDTRPSTQSPAIKFGPDGQTIGATLDVAAYQRGDFDGDGKRDLPELPAEVKAGLPNPNNLTLPSY